MVNVSFDEVKIEATSREILGEKVVPGMADKLKKIGLAGSDIAAKRILIGVIIVCFALSVVILARSSHRPEINTSKTYQPRIPLPR